MNNSWSFTELNTENILFSDSKIICTILATNIFTALTFSPPKNVTITPVNYCSSKTAAYAQVNIFILTGGNNLRHIMDVTNT